jgi:NTE family protein
MAETRRARGLLRSGDAVHSLLLEGLKLLFLLALAFDAGAQATRPTVALALGGGGARGGAHIGVLQALEALRIPVDCIAATSMGALVGGAYAAGISPEEISDLVRETDWINIFDDSAGRAEINLRRKELEDKYFSGLEFGVTSKGLRYREGAVAGEKLKLFFNRLVRAELGERPIEELPIPISIIATDIGNGDRVAIRSGELTTAMRASMSVPGLIAPVVREGRKLVDGGLTDNLPVQEARSLCKADVVIAVNVGSPLYKPEEVTGVFTVLGQVVNLLTEQNVAKSRAAIGGNDVYVEVDLGDIGATQFTRQLEAADRGRLAMEAMADTLKRLTVPQAVYSAWREKRQLAKPRELPVIDEVQVADTRYVNPRKIRRGIRQEEGKPLDPQKLNADLVQEYSQGDLQSLDYSVLHERNKTILRITPMEKSWGPDYLRFGLNFSSDFRSESTYQLRALYQRTWLNALGGEWLVAAQIGSDQNIGTEFYQPFDSRQRFFATPYARTSLRKLGIYVDGDRLANYRIQDSRAGLDVGTNLGVYGQFRAGWMERRLGSVLDTGPDFFPNVTERVSGPRAALAIDTYDQPFFPTRGIKLDVTHFDAHRVSSNVEEYSRSEARFGAAGTLGSWTVLGGLEGGYTGKGSLPLGDAFTLGGPRRLSGFATDQLLGGEYAFGRLEAQYRLTLPMPVFGLSLIGGLLAESGRMNKRITETGLSGWQNSFGAYLAASTALGPFYIGFADAKNGKGRFYLFIGSP